MEKIIIKNLAIYAFHGVNPEEKENGQPFVLDVTVHANLSLACHNDRLNDTLNYSQMIKTIRRAMLKDKYDLIEYTAQRVIDALFNEYSKIKQVDLVLKKPHAPINEKFSYVAVELSRKR